MTPPTALQKAISLLSRRDYSALELRRKLSRKYPTAEINAAIRRLRETRLLDEERLALERARVRRESQLWGDLKIRNDLARIGIDDRIIDRVLEATEGFLGESASLDLLTRRWTAANGEPESKRALKRLFDYCLRRGYRAELIRNKLERWWGQASRD